MSKILLYGLLMLGVAACTTSAAEQRAAAEKKAAAEGRTYVPAERVLESGTRVAAQIQDSLSSRRNKAGEDFWAIVSSDVEDGNGHVVIPAGSPVEMRIEQLKATTNVAQKDGKLELSVSSVNVRGRVYQLSAALDPVQHHLQGRGLTPGDVATVGVGAAAGAVAGQVIGKNAKGAIIGGVIGAGAGTAVAVTAANRDVVVNRGTPIVFTLTRQLSVSTK